MTSISLRELAVAKRMRVAGVVVVTLLAAHIALAQQQLSDSSSGTTEVPAAQPAQPEQPAPPVAPAQADADKPAQGPLTDADSGVDKRILGVLPNYRTADGTLPFQTVSPKYKLTIASKDSFDWPNYIVGGAFAGLYMLEKDHPEFGEGVSGFARYYGTSYADQVIGNMLTEGFMPILFREDPRYFRMVHGTIFKRTMYSLSRVLITKTDSGKETMNLSEIFGNGIGASISNLYYPDQRGFSQTTVRWGTQVATDALSQVLKEFWPDIKRKLHHHTQDAQAITASH